MPSSKRSSLWQRSAGSARSRRLKSNYDFQYKVGILSGRDTNSSMYLYRAERALRNDVLRSYPPPGSNSSSSGCTPSSSSIVSFRTFTLYLTRGMRRGPMFVSQCLAAALAPELNVDRHVVSSLCALSAYHCKGKNQRRQSDAGLRVRQMTRHELAGNVN